MKSTIWIACGGTGGHFLPGVVVGRALESHGFQVRYFGEGKAVEEDLCKAQEIDMVRPPQSHRNSRLKKLSWVMKELSKRKKEDLPIAVLGFGGFSSAALGIWSTLNRCPLFLFEQNAVPGRVNRLLAPFAKAIFLTFPLVGKKLRNRYQHLTGNPVREAAEKPPKKSYDLLVLGGSQGALALNQKLPPLLPEDWSILHIAGPGRKQEVLDADKGKHQKLKVIDSHPDVPYLLANSRWVISRSGATSLCEIAQSGNPCITVPLPTSRDDHQRHNAAYLEARQGLVVVEESTFEGETLCGALQNPDLALVLSSGIRHSGIADEKGTRCLEKLLPFIITN